MQKAQRRQNAVTRSSAHEFSLGENIPRSSFACRQLSLDSRGMRKFGHAYSASENLHLFSAPLCGRCLWFWQRCIFFEVTVAIIIAGNSNFKIHPAPLKSTVRARLFFGLSAKVRASEWVEVYLHFQRAQPKFAEGKDCLTVSYTRIAWITEGVPQHPKNRRQAWVTRLVRLRNVAFRQLVNKERDDWSFRVPGLWYFGRQSTE